MKTPNSFELADMLKDYYPSGFNEDFPLLYEGYHKYPKVMQVIEEKIRRIHTEKDDPLWKDFIEKLEKQFRKEQIYNLSYQQAPDLFLKIEIEDRTSDEILVKKFICVGISLLIPYSIIFIEIEIGTNRFLADEERNGSKILSRANYPRKIIAYGQENASLRENEYMEKLKIMLSECYPGHELLSHYSVLRRNLYSEEKDGQITDIEYRFSKYMLGSYEYSLFEKDGFEVFK